MAYRRPRTFKEGCAGFMGVAIVCGIAGGFITFGMSFIIPMIIIILIIILTIVLALYLKFYLKKSKKQSGIEKKSKLIEASRLNIEALEQKNTGKYEEALILFDKSLNFNPNNMGVWINKGTTLECLERYDEELECYEKALQINPRDLYSAQKKESVKKKIEQGNNS